MSSEKEIVVPHIQSSICEIMVVFLSRYFPCQPLGNTPVSDSFNTNLPTFFDMITPLSSSFGKMVLAVLSIEKLCEFATSN